MFQVCFLHRHLFLCLRPAARYIPVGQQACRRLIGILHIQGIILYPRCTQTLFPAGSLYLRPFPELPDLLLRQIIENSLVPPPHISIHLGIFPEYFQRQRQHEAGTEGDGDNEKKIPFFIRFQAVCRQPPNDARIQVL